MRVQALGIADTRGEFVTRALARLELTLEGIPGDRHAGRTLKAGVRQKQVPRGTVLPNTRQLSLVSAEELDQLAAALGVDRVDYRALGANLVLAGAPGLTGWPAGGRLVFEGGAVLVNDGRNEPCRKAGRALAQVLHAEASLVTRFVREAQRLRGLVAWVERPAPIALGERVTLVSG